MEKDLANGIKNLSNSLNKHQVKYMFVGGVAISFYGSARPSSNLPFAIRSLLPCNPKMAKECLFVGKMM